MYTNLTTEQIKQLAAITKRPIKKKRVPILKPIGPTWKSFIERQKESPLTKTFKYQGTQTRTPKNQGTYSINFRTKYGIVDKTELSNEQAAILQTQNREIKNWCDDLDKSIRKQISILTLRENTVWIKEQLDAKEKAEKERDAEKEKREQAERERDSKQGLLLL